MKISIIGTGYVGLVTGVCLSETGNEVMCIDKDKNKIERLKNCDMPIYEPGLENMVKNNIQRKQLSFSTDIREGLNFSNICYIAVGTPMEEDGSADLRYVLEVASTIGKYMHHRMYVIDKSTVPVGTAQKVRTAIQKELDMRGSQLSFDVISNPEFLKEGNAIADSMRPDRIVIGTDSQEAADIMKELYKAFIINTNNFIVMDVASAEMTKYAANCMLATKISFMNEIANICDRTGADVNKVRLGIGSDRRIGYHFIYPGCGYGGSCFPKDVQALIRTADAAGYDSKLLKSVENVNMAQKYILVEKIMKHFGENLNQYTFAIWGLTFKPETDDMREATSIIVINELLKHGAKIIAYDPKATEAEKKHYFPQNSALKFVDSKYSALCGADALVLITEWAEFRTPDFEEIKKRMRTAIIFDGRNQYSDEIAAKYGFTYFQIGVSKN